jgi:hypothetical protein
MAKLFLLGIFHERQKQSFKTGANLPVIHGRRLPYNKTYRLSLKFIPQSRVLALRE